jgi:hypothetical protein
MSESTRNFWIALTIFAVAFAGAKSYRQWKQGAAGLFAARKSECRMRMEQNAHRWEHYGPTQTHCRRSPDGPRPAQP